MSGSGFSIDWSQMEAFFKKIKKASKGDFKREMQTFLEGLGFEFLRILEDEIIRRRVMDTRLLLNSFHRGHKDNVWIYDDGKMTLEVGTNLTYAQYVNDGHWTCKKGEKGRWIPGEWHGDRFIYRKGAKTGMYLKQQWVEGAHYWESALRIMERIYPRLLEKKLQEWLDKYFEEFMR